MKIIVKVIPDPPKIPVSPNPTKAPLSLMNAITDPLKTADNLEKQKEKALVHKNLATVFEQPCNFDIFKVIKTPEGRIDSFQWVYYNPHSVAGGQLVYNSFDAMTVLEACNLFTEPQNILEYIEEFCDQTFCDITSENFESEYKAFVSSPKSKECLFALNIDKPEKPLAEYLLVLISFAISNFS